MNKNSFILMRWFLLCVILISCSENDILPDKDNENTSEPDIEDCITVEIETGKTLDDYLTLAQKRTISCLKIVGDLSDPSLEVIREMGDNANLSILDLLEAHILEGMNQEENQIGLRMFEGCKNLIRVILPYEATEIRHSSFDHCRNLESVVIYNKVRKMSLDAFYYCTKLKELNIPESVQKIEHSLTRCDSLACINVSENNPYYRSIDGVLYSKDVDTLFCYPSGKKDKVYTVPESVKEINQNACEYNSYVETVIVLGNISVGSWAFRYCSDLRTIYFLGETTLLYSSCFQTDFIKEIYFASMKPFIGPDDVLNSISKNLTIYIPLGTYDAYWEALGRSYWAGKSLKEIDMTNILSMAYN